MTPAETFTLAAYFFVLIVLAVYGWHRYYLVYLYMRNRDKEPKPQPPLDPLPAVTIQLPLYNEMYVADRLIDAVCAIDYSRELLEIQVLDDSTDETCSVAELGRPYVVVDGTRNHTMYKPSTAIDSATVAAGDQRRRRPSRPTACTRSAAPMRGNAKEPSRKTRPKLSAAALLRTARASAGASRRDAIAGSSGSKRSGRVAMRRRR